MKYIEIDARNTYWNKDAENFLNALTNKANNIFVKKYVKTTFRRYLDQTYPAEITKATDLPSWAKNKEIHELVISDSDKTKFLHYIDYLNTLPERPISMSFSDLEKHIKSWEKSFHKSINVKEDGIKLLYKYNNGFSWVKVFGKDSLNREGKVMGHCVGSYYNKVKEDRCEIYSLRDKNNKPHVTIEFKPQNKRIEQIKGHFNSVPSKYIPYINHFLKKISINEINNFDLNPLGLFYQDQKIYSIEDIPNNFKIKDGLNLRNSIVTNLPDNLTIEGDLYLDNSHITELPKNLIIEGNLNLVGTQITSLPESLRVKGDLNLRNTRISEIKSTNIPGTLDLRSSQINKLPKKLIVHGNLDLRNTKIKELPEDLIVEGNLYLKNSQITRLPSRLKVNGLFINSTKITSLPENLGTLSELDASDSLIIKLPKLRVTGGLILKNTRLTSLPEGLEAETISLGNTPITELPNKLTVGVLNIKNTKITFLPNDIKVNQYVIADKGQLKGIKNIKVFNY